MGGLYAVLFGSVIFEATGHPLAVNSFMMAGYAKAVITFVKYMPQVYLNWKRKSTVGWSLENVCLDMTGGLLSFFQQFIDSAILGKSLFGNETFNVIKFCLSVMSICFDSVFLF